jgi:hypothetical protein
MSQLLLTPCHGRVESNSAISDDSLSEPERELHGFIHSLASLIGPGATKSLTELWLDELACMDCIPGPHSPDWRLVSLAASVKLACRVITSQLSLYTNDELSSVRSYFAHITAA